MQAATTAHKIVKLVPLHAHILHIVLLVDLMLVHRHIDLHLFFALLLFYAHTLSFLFYPVIPYRHIHVRV